MKKIRDLERLKHIRDAIDYIQRHTAGIDFETFEAHELLPFAVVKHLEIIGEAVNQPDDETKEQQPQIEWRKIINARHIFVHVYHDTDWEIVWMIITNYLPELKKAIAEMIKTEEQA